MGRGHKILNIIVCLIEMSIIFIYLTISHKILTSTDCESIMMFLFAIYGLYVIGNQLVYTIAKDPLFKEFILNKCPTKITGLYFLVLVLILMQELPITGSYRLLIVIIVITLSILDYISK